MANKEWLKKGVDGLEFGERLGDLIAHYKTTATAIANEVRIPQSAISEYLNKNREPSCAAIIALAKHFGVSTDYLLGLSKVKTSSTDMQAIISYTGLSEENALTLHRMQVGRSEPVVSAHSGDSEVINASEPYLDCLNDLLAAMGTQKESLIRDYMLIRYYADGCKSYDPNYFNEYREMEMLEHGHTSVPVRVLIEYKCIQIAKAIERYLLDKYTSTESE